MPKLEQIVKVLVPGWFVSASAEPDPAQQVADREAERKAFIAKYNLAVDAGDTRQQHATWPAAYAATNASLRASVGR